MSLWGPYYEMYTKTTQKKHTNKNKKQKTGWELGSRLLPWNSAASRGSLSPLLLLRGWSACPLPTASRSILIKVLPHRVQLHHDLSITRDFLSVVCLSSTKDVSHSYYSHYRLRPSWRNKRQEWTLFSLAQGACPAKLWVKGKQARAQKSILECHSP